MKYRIRELGIVMLFAFAVMSCQSEIPPGNAVVFGDVIGDYSGECADYISSTSELMNREEATLTVFAANISSAGIKTSCDRIQDQELPVKNASASEIIFEISENNINYTMIYIAEKDSITVIKEEEGKDENLIFTGIRN